MTEMTKKQRKKYLKNGGGHCPYCESTQVEGDSYDYAEGNIYQPMSCNACDETWVDCYHLANVLD